MSIPTKVQQLRHLLDARSSMQHALRVELAFVDVCGGNHVVAMVLGLLLDLHHVAVAQHRWTVAPFTGWLPVPWDGWWRHARVKERTGRRYLAQLTALKLIRVHTFQMGNARKRMLHVQVCEEQLLTAWLSALEGNAPLFPAPCDAD